MFTEKTTQPQKCFVIAKINKALQVYSIAFLKTNRGWIITTCLSIYLFLFEEVHVPVIREVKKKKMQT